MTSGLTQRLLAVLAAPAIGLAMGGGACAAGERPVALAQADSAPPARGGVPAATRHVRASKLLGTDVRSPRGEDLGDIQDLILDVQGGRVRYAVLAFGGFLGLGDKLFAYPVSAFRPSITSDELVLDVDRERLRGAPGFARDRWPNWGRDGYGRDVDRYFGQTADEAQGRRRLLRASEVIGKAVEDAGGNKIGDIDELVLDMSDGRVPYAVVKFDRNWSGDDRLQPLALEAFDFGGEQADKILLRRSRDEIDMKRGFPANRWPNLNDPAWRRGLGGGGAAR